MVATGVKVMASDDLIRFGLLAVWRSRGILWSFAGAAQVGNKLKISKQLAAMITDVNFKIGLIIAPYIPYTVHYIHRLDTADERLFREVIAMARERDIHLHVHSGAEPVRWLYGLEPEVKIIWAHAGLGEPASAVFDLMAEHPSLVADTSLREYQILGRGDDLDPEWKRIIMAFPDRLMVGSDTWVNSQWEDYDEIIASNRRWLAKLPRNIAEMIAYRNAERLFGRTISMKKVGTR
jgi:hypothetical protein